jgi:hypothetical protein
MVIETRGKVARNAFYYALHEKGDELSFDAHGNNAESFTLDNKKILENIVVSLEFQYKIPFRDREFMHGVIETFLKHCGRVGHGKPEFKYNVNKFGHEIRFKKK